MEPLSAVDASRPLSGRGRGRACALAVRSHSELVSVRHYEMPFSSRGHSAFGSMLGCGCAMPKYSPIGFQAVSFWGGCSRCLHYLPGPNPAKGSNASPWLPMR